MNCNCLAQIDDKLEEKNLRLTGIVLLLPSCKCVISLKTEWIDSGIAPKGMKRNPPSMHSSHCPFCGIKISTDKEVQS